MQRIIEHNFEPAAWPSASAVSWMALIVFVATFLIAGGVYLVATRLAETEWARAFKAVSPGLLPVLGVLFASLSTTTSDSKLGFRRAATREANVVVSCPMRWPFSIATPISGARRSNRARLFNVSSVTV